MAMEKLGQLYDKGEWDLIVVDTPPSRSALDFLDAPNRLGSFLDGKFIKILSAPAKVGGFGGAFKLLTGGVSLVTGVLGKLLGSGLLADVQAFVNALDTMFGGFRERAEATYRLLQAKGTSFVVVAAPEPDALREASYFARRLAEERMPLAGLVLNRVHPRLTDLTAERSLAAAEQLNADSGPAQALAGGLLRLHAERVELNRRESKLADRFVASHPGIELLRLPALAEDVHDLEGLRLVTAEADGR
jgi:anion-transporting  ArsA/GET3 family ATPase